jgi:hypothetical protein
VATYSTRSPASTLENKGLFMFSFVRLIFFGTVLLVAPLSTNDTKAAMGDNIGINSARRVSEAVEYAVRVLSSMQERFGVDLRDTIKALKEMEQEAFQKMDSIARDRIDQVGRVADETLAKIRNIENETFDRINNLVSCAPQVMTNAVEESLSNIRIWKFTINYKTRADLSPANQYFAAREEILKSLRDIPPTASVEGVMASYGEISRLAKLAQCHYKTEPIGVELIKQSEYYSQEALPWALVLRR